MIIIMWWVIFLLLAIVAFLGLAYFFKCQECDGWNEYICFIEHRLDKMREICSDLFKKYGNAGKEVNDHDCMDYIADAVRVGRCNYRCTVCGADVSLRFFLYQDALEGNR